MRKHEILPQQRIIGRPFCELCKSQMWLACIEPDEPGHDKRVVRIVAQEVVEQADGFPEIDCDVLAFNINVTGLSLLATELSAKRLALLKETLPGIKS